MTLVRYKNHIECSFVLWMNRCPESNHPTDDENFYCFVKTVCGYPRTKKWRDVIYLKNRILEKIPNFNSDKLENILTIYIKLLDFYKIPPLKNGLFIDPDARDVRRGYYIERECKQGKIYEREVPLNIPEGEIAIYDEKSKNYKAK